MRLSATAAAIPVAAAGGTGSAVRVGLGAILVLFIGLATIYNVVNPLFEAPDEIWHYLFAKYVRENGQLPLQAPTRGEVISQ